ncbi:MAG: ABC transporter ATP-binding protein [Opitutales bacterium]|nr:ABC transporter ATP-binding protein [Opitutales bacterium]
MPENDPYIIKLEGIEKVYYTDEIETYALSGVHLNIKKGEFVVISGPSGCGKSTLLSIAGLLDLPTVGNYRFRTHDTANLKGKERASIRNNEIGFIFQSFNLIGNLTVFENVELPLIYRRIKKEKRKEMTLAALERVQMTHRRNHLPSQLSGGQQQRVAVARAIVGGPAVMFADEPTGNLDTQNGNRVMEILKELNNDGATLVMVTHEKAYESYADRVVKMLDGKVMEIVDQKSKRGVA